MRAIPAKGLTNLGQAVELVRKESDRGAALLMGEWMNEMCGSLLRRSLVEGFNDEELLDHQNPLSTFSSRSLACYALGLISKDVYQSLRLIRKIRNAAAHFTETNDGSDGVDFSLDSEPTRSHINALRRTLEKSPEYLGTDSREELILCFGALSGHMFRQRSRTKRAAPAEEMLKL